MLHNARRAMVAVLIVGLAGCVADLGLRPNLPPADEWPQGVFTGEFVDGLPLYRFPTIVVVGSRSSLGAAVDSD